MKKILKPAAIVLLVFMIAFRPQPTAEAAQNIVSVLGEMASGVSEFVTSLFQ